MADVMARYEDRTFLGSSAGCEQGRHAFTPVVRDSVLRIRCRWQSRCRGRSCRWESKLTLGGGSGWSPAGLHVGIERIGRSHQPLWGQPWAGPVWGPGGGAEFRGPAGQRL